MTFSPSDATYFLKIAQTLPVAVFAIDINHQVTFWNPACERLTGVKSSEVVGTNKHWAPFYNSLRPLLSDLIVEQMPYEEVLKRYGTRNKLSLHLQGGLEAEEYFSAIGDKGRWLSFLAAPLEDESGKIIGAIEIVQDITSRKFEEESLRSSAEELNAIFQNSGDAVCVFGVNYDIIKVNRAMESLLKMPADAFVGKKCYNVFQAAECRTKQCPLQRIHAGESFFSIDAVRKRSDDVLVDVECISTPIKFHNIVIGMISSYRDVTERKRAQAQIEGMAEELQKLNEHLELKVEERTAEAVKERQKAEEANKAKSMFLANMSHELRTPLHGIINFADFGIDKYADAPKEKILKYFQKIKTSGHLLLSLVNDLLDLVKLESGKMIFSFKEKDIFLTLMRIADEFREQADVKNVKIVTSLNVPSRLIAFDEEKILQVLRNLMGNALKFSPQGGVIKITISEDRDSMKVGVSDRGIGVPEAERESIFDKFVQSSKTRTGAGGTGLGLSISKEIIEMHHGRIWVEPGPEGGSVFYFTISKYLKK